MLTKTPLKKKKSETIRPNRRTTTKNNNGQHRYNSTLRSVRSSYDTVYGTKKEAAKKKIKLPSIAAWKIIVGALVIGALGVLYLNHVFATQKLLSQVDQLENEYQQAKRLHDDYQLSYDRMIGPKEVYEKAKDLGFINGGPAEQVITVEGDSDAE